MGQMMVSVRVMVSVRTGIAMVGAALALAVGPLAAPAQADDATSVQVVSQEGRDVGFLVYLAPGVKATSDVKSRVIISGAEVPSEAVAIVDEQVPDEAILVLDISGSMKGPRLAAAKDAAANYVRALPADVEVGLVSFNDQAEQVLAPTTDKQAVIAAIDSLTAGQKTALYDGIVAGVDAARAGKTTRLVLLSDGGDTVSAATLKDGQAAADAAGIAIDVVALNPTAEHAEILRGVARGSGGQFLLAADAIGLEDVFREATGSFGGKISVTAQVPEDVDASGKFAIVTVAVNGEDFTGTSQLPSSDALAGPEGATPAVPVPTAGPTAGGSDAQVLERASNPVAAWIYAVLMALIVIAVALAIASYRRQQRARLRTEQVLWYSSAVVAGVAPGQRPQARPSGVLDTLDAWMAEKSWYAGIDTKLDNGGVPINVATWLSIRVAATLVLALLVGLLLGNVWIGLLLGGLIGWVVSGMWLNSKESARRKAFEQELPDFLMLIASSLRSGLSFQQALDSTAAEGQGEVSRQMRRALSEVQMGSTIEAALMRVSNRMQSEDLKWTVTALAIQREVGGNLSSILDTAAQTIKQRAELRREVRTLSAEGRLSGWVLAALPVGLFLYMFFANRAYISFFWTYTVGWFALGALVVLFVLGFIWMRKLARIEV